MAWNDDERAHEVSPFKGAVIKGCRPPRRGAEEFCLWKICKQIVKESADPYKIMPAPLPEEEDAYPDAFDNPYYCAKSPSLESFNTLQSEEEPDESVSSSCEDEAEPATAGRGGSEEADTAAEKSAEPQPFFYT